MASPETLAIFKRLTTNTANQKCIDCNTPNPQWASAKFGCFFCLECSGRHRGLGVHIDFVRSVYMDSWKPAELRRMEMGGNDKLKAYLVAKGVDSLPIEKKYTSHAALLYRDKLGCLVDGTQFNEHAALQQIIRMENDAKERQRQLEASRPASVSSQPLPTRRVDSVLDWNTLAQSTSDLLGRAAATTSQVTTQIKAAGVVETLKYGASAAAESTRSWLGTTQQQQQQQQTQFNTASSSGSNMPAVSSNTTNVGANSSTPRSFANARAVSSDMYFAGTEGGSADGGGGGSGGRQSNGDSGVALQRARDLSGRGLGVLATTWGTCLSTAQDTITSVRKHYTGNAADSNTTDQADSNTSRHNSDLSDLFGELDTGRGSDNLDAGRRSNSETNVGVVGGRGSWDWRKDTADKTTANGNDLSDLFPVAKEEEQQQSYGGFGASAAVKKNSVDEWGFGATSTQQQQLADKQQADKQPATKQSDDNDLSWAHDDWTSPAFAQQKNNTAKNTTPATTTTTTANAKSTNPPPTSPQDDLDWAWGGDKW